MPMPFYVSPLDLKYLSADHSHQTTGEKLLNIFLAKNDDIKMVMDLGCGEGRTAYIFRRVNPKIRWVGLDIENSPQVKKRTIKDALFCSFDGVKIPFADNSFDLVYSNQVMEHVRYPQELLSEVNRILKYGGCFIGSTSQLETYHTFSYWNFTPYGFVTLVEDANLTIEEIRPSIDGITLLIRTALGNPSFFNRWWGMETESPVNKLITLYGRIRRRDHQQINAAKLLLCGQFSFLIRKLHADS